MQVSNRREFLNQHIFVLRCGRRIGKMGSELFTAERKEDRLLFTISIFTAATFFLFGSLQMYLSNISELWFSLSDAIIGCLIGFGFAVAGLILLGALLCFWKAPFYCYLLFTWGVGLAFYIQGNLVPMKLGVLNGADTNWEAYQKESWFSIIVWTICVILPFLLTRLFKKAWKKILQNLSIAFLFLQLITVVLLCITMNSSKVKKADYYLSSDGLYDVGGGKNVVYFVLDSYDQQFFEKVCNQEPELKDFLDGFTWFTNATNVFPNTMTSIRFLLTQQPYLNDLTFTEYTAKSWMLCDGYYRMLQNAGFDINIYTAEEKAVPESTKASLVKNAENQQLKISSYVGLTESLLRLTAIRYFPDVLKQYVWVSDYNSLFEPLKETGQNTPAYTWEDAAFYWGLVDRGLSLVKNNQFKFVHLRGVHTPNSLLEDLTIAEDPSDAGIITEAKASLKILREYCDQLKALGAYDNTCIVITADHGSYDRSMGTPIFLVKGFDSRGPLVVSNVPVSHENLMATVADELSLNTANQYGISVFNVTKENAKPRRYFRYDALEFGIMATGHVSPIVEYAVQPEGNLPENFIYTGKVYTPDGMRETVPYQCIVGEPIQIQDAESLQYFISGVPIYLEKAKYVRIQERTGKMRFAFGQTEGDLICTMSLNSFIPGGQQRFIVFHEGEELYREEILSGTTEISFTIPNYCIMDGVLELEFQCPDGLTPWELGTGQNTEVPLSFAIHQILFTRAPE